MEQMKIFRGKNTTSFIGGGNVVVCDGPDREANAQLFLRAQHMGELVEALSEVGVWTIEEDAGYVRVNICNVEIARVRSDSAKAAALFKFDAKQRAILAKIGGNNGPL